jgi:4-hydroxybenzoate polyprenyltransferase
MMPYLRLMRPHQWIKNIVVLAGPAFSLHIFEVEVVVVFAAFCLIASACYTINDLADRTADKSHPTKKDRPIASGAVSPASALVLAVVLACTSVGMSVAYLPPLVTWLLLSYFFLVLAYSLALKRRPILDVIVIAVGFVLRAVAGAAAVSVPVSPWLIACTFTLCMFLGFGKRRCELATLANKADAGAHRSTLLRYTPELLNHLTSVSAGIAIMTFLLYTMDSTPAADHPPFKKEYLLYTLPLVAYALFRYAMLIETGRFTGPTQIVLKDKALLLTGFLWALAAGGIVGLTRVQPVNHDGPAGAPVIEQATPAGVIENHE